MRKFNYELLSKAIGLPGLISKLRRDQNRQARAPWHLPGLNCVSGRTRAQNRLTEARGPSFELANGRAGTGLAESCRDLRRVAASNCDPHFVQQSYYRYAIVNNKPWPLNYPLHSPPTLLHLHANFIVC